MLALDPRETYEVRLPTDPRAVFVFRHMTLREFRRAGKVYDRGIDRTFDGMLDDLLAAIRMNLVGWREIISAQGAAIPYDPENLEDVLTHQEAWDLLGEARKGAILTSAEKNVSGSSSAGSGAGSAPAAAQGPGDAGVANAPTARA